MAAALGAEYCEICSDVDGVYTADPRVVPAARRIGTLSYEETQELAESGAKVLNAQAVEFAKEKGIAIYARATASPLPGADPSADGTVVRRHPAAACRAPSSASPASATCWCSQSRSDRLTPSRSGRRCALLDEHEVAGKQLHVAGDRLTLVVSRENLHEEAARPRGARRAVRRRASAIADDLGAVSVVGAGINASFDERPPRHRRRSSRAGIGRDGIATSSFRITWMIERDAARRRRPRPAPRVRGDAATAGALNASVKLARPPPGAKLSVSGG